MQPKLERLLHVGGVIEATSLSRATIYSYVAAGLFPKPVRITANRVGWPESAVAAWIAARIADAG